MKFENGCFKLGVIILDDRSDSRMEVYRSISDAFFEYCALQSCMERDKYFLYMPERLIDKNKKASELEDSYFLEASDYLHNSEDTDVADLVIIDIDWAPETGNLDGIALAQIIYKRQDIAKFFFTGSPKRIVQEALVERIPGYIKKGYHFYQDVFLKPHDFAIEKFVGVVEFAMQIFKKKRAKYLKLHCHSSEILALIKRPELSSNDTLMVKGQDGKFCNVPLENIFFECREPEQYREALKACYHAKSRFEIMKTFWSHKEVLFASHVTDEERFKRVVELLTSGSFKEKSLYQATQFYYGEIKPEFGAEEAKVIEEFFEDVEKLVNRFGMDSSKSDSINKLIDNYISELHFIGNKLKRRTRFYLEEFKNLFKKEHHVNLHPSLLDSEWFCYVGDFVDGSASFSLDQIGDDGVKGHFMTLWNILEDTNRFIEVLDKIEEKGLVLLEIKGKLTPSEKHKNGGAFDLHGSTLQDRIVEGNNLKKIVHLLPHYFSPFIVESLGENGDWQCVNFSVTDGAHHEVLINADHFQRLTGLPALNQTMDKNTGVRFLLGIERCK